MDCDAFPAILESGISSLSGLINPNPIQPYYSIRIRLTNPWISMGGRYLIIQPSSSEMIILHSKSENFGGQTTWDCCRLPHGWMDTWMHTTECGIWDMIWSMMFYVQYGVRGYKSFIEAAFICIDYSRLHDTIFFLKKTSRKSYCIPRSPERLCKFLNSLIPHMGNSEHTKTMWTYHRTINNFKSKTKTEIMTKWYTVTTRDSNQDSKGIMSY